MHVDGRIRKGIPKDACGWEERNVDGRIRKGIPKDVDGRIRKGIPKDACGWEDKERNTEGCMGMGG